MFNAVPGIEIEEACDRFFQSRVEIPWMNDMTVCAFCKKLTEVKNPYSHVMGGSSGNLN